MGILKKEICRKCISKRQRYVDSLDDSFEYMRGGSGYFRDKRNDIWYAGYYFDLRWDVHFLPVYFKTIREKDMIEGSKESVEIPDWCEYKLEHLVADEILDELMLQKVKKWGKRWISYPIRGVISQLRVWLN